MIVRRTLTVSSHFLCMMPSRCQSDGFCAAEASKPVRVCILISHVNHGLRGSTSPISYANRPQQSEKGDEHAPCTACDEYRASPPAEAEDNNRLEVLLFDHLDDLVDVACYVSLITLACPTSALSSATSPASADSQMTSVSSRRGTQPCHAHIPHAGSKWSALFTA